MGRDGKLTKISQGLTWHPELRKNEAAEEIESLALEGLMERLEPIMHDRPLKARLRAAIDGRLKGSLKNVRKAVRGSLKRLKHQGHRCGRAAPDSRRSTYSWSACSQREGVACPEPITTTARGRPIAEGAGGPGRGRVGPVIEEERTIVEMTMDGCSQTKIGETPRQEQIRRRKETRTLSRRLFARIAGPTGNTAQGMSHFPEFTPHYSDEWTNTAFPSNHRDMEGVTGQARRSFVGTGTQSRVTLRPHAHLIREIDRTLKESEPPATSAR